MIRSRSALLLGLLLGGCAIASPRPATPVPATPPATPTSAAPIASPTPSPASTTATPVQPCRVEPRPPAVTPPSTSCRDVATLVQDDLRSHFQAKFFRRHRRVQLDTSFACDPLAAPRQLVYEFGGVDELTIVRVLWNGDTIEGLRLTMTRATHDPDQYTIKEERADIARTTMMSAMAEIRALLLARLVEKVEEREPRQQSRSAGKTRWHARVRLVDEDGRVLERGVTGFREASDEQLEMLPMIRVIDRLKLASKGWWTNRRGEYIDDTRAFFSEHFLATIPAAKWWVKQFEIQLAAEYGTPALIPALIAVARDDDPRESQRLHRMYALASLAALAGFDARRDANGREVAEADAAAAYARACLN